MEQILPKIKEKNKEVKKNKTKTIYIINKKFLKKNNLKNKIYKLVKKIPKGKITTYKEIGEKLNTKAYRLIGQILSKNKNKKIPCHRVINSNGSIGGYLGIKNNPEKIKILKKEGLKIKKNKIEIKKYFFNLK